MTTLADVDLTDLDNFAAGFPHDLFELHRRDAPVERARSSRHTGIRQLPLPLGPRPALRAGDGVG